MPDLCPQCRGVDGVHSGACTVPAIERDMAAYGWRAVDPDEPVSIEAASYYDGDVAAVGVRLSGSSPANRERVAAEWPDALALMVARIAGRQRLAEIGLTAAVVEEISADVRAAATAHKVSEADLWRRLQVELDQGYTPALPRTIEGETDSGS